MKLIIQRVRHASVTVDQKIVGEIAKGYLVLVGVCDTDTEEIAEKMVRKMLIAAKETVRLLPRPEILI